jgi:cullin-associated NEDD8-dissociated protein 1
LEHYGTVAPLLLSRFKEREESVKIDIFHAYEALLKQTRLFLPESLSNLDTTMYNAAVNFNSNKSN